LIFAAALACLIGIGGTKIALALEAGRTNVGYLFLMMIAAVIIAYLVSHPYRTVRGEALLANTRALFAHLRRRATSIHAGTGSPDLLWVSALFGVGVLSASAFPWAAYFGGNVRGEGAGAGGGCGTGGSGCGGGGGGGGGGCGGCGSG
jgi:hypothetical protein